MDIKEFQKTYHLSRGQAERLIAKARKNENRFELSGFGKFMITQTGTAKTSKIDIFADAGADIAPDPTPDTGKPLSSLQPAQKSKSIKRSSKLEDLSGQELLKLRTVAQIQKLRESTEQGRRETRRQYMTEALDLVIRCFLPLRSTLESLNLSLEQLDTLRSALETSLENVRKEQEKNDDSIE